MWLIRKRRGCLTWAIIISMDIIIITVIIINIISVITTVFIDIFWSLAQNKFVTIFFKFVISNYNFQC